jgi:hypothetical protein
MASPVLLLSFNLISLYLANNNTHPKSGTHELNHRHTCVILRFSVSLTGFGTSKNWTEPTSTGSVQFSSVERRVSTSHSLNQLRLVEDWSWSSLHREDMYLIYSIYCVRLLLVAKISNWTPRDQSCFSSCSHDSRTTSLYYIQ